MSIMAAVRANHRRAWLLGLSSGVALSILSRRIESRPWWIEILAFLSVSLLTGFLATRSEQRALTRVARAIERLLAGARPYSPPAPPGQLDPLLGDSTDTRGSRP